MNMDIEKGEEEKLIRGENPLYKAGVEENEDELIENGEGKKLLNDENPLYKAVVKGNVDELQELLKDKNYKKDINGLFVSSQKECEVEKTLLCVATEKGYTKCLTELIKNGANLNECSSDEKTPLHIAAEKGNKDHLILLLENGAERDKGGPFGVTPAFLAALKKHRGCLTELIKRGASVRRSKTIFETNEDAKNFKEAIKFGQVKKVKDLYQEKKDFLFEIIGIRDETGKTLFHHAVENNREECLRVLIQMALEKETNSIDTNSEKKESVFDKANVYGHTPLYVSALLKNECFAPLKKNGANFSKASYSAALEGERECLERFIDEDIDWSYKGHKLCSKNMTQKVEKKSKCVIFEDSTLERHDDEGETKCLQCFIEEDGLENKEECHERDDLYCNSLIEEVFTHVSEPVDFVNDVLNSSSIDIEKANVNKEKIYKVDFKMFLPKKNTDRGQMHTFACLLNAMNSEEEIGVLNHIFCELFLDAKLETSLFWILAVRLIVWYAYFACILAYTAVVLKIYDSFDHGWIISIICIFLAIRFLVQMNKIGLLWNDHNSRNYSVWTVVNSVIAMGSVMLTIFYLIITLSFMNNSMMHGHDISAFKNLLAIIIVILHNIEFILIHLMFIVVSKYYAMFLTVLYKTLKAILFLFLPILCFIFIFRLQFSYYSEFSTIFRTFVKTIVLMTGELEYEDTLHNSLHNATSFHLQENTEDRSNLEFLYVRFMFLVFIVLINLVMLNLIIGLSVDNVAMAKKTGNAVSIRQKAEFCIQVEEFLSYTKTNCCIQWIKNVAIYLENKSKIESPYVMKRSKFALLRQKTFDSLDELVRNNNLSKKESMLSSFLYDYSSSTKRVKEGTGAISKNISEISTGNVDHE